MGIDLATWNYGIGSIDISGSLLMPQPVSETVDNGEKESRATRAGSLKTAELSISSRNCGLLFSKCVK